MFDGPKTTKNQPFNTMADNICVGFLLIPVVIAIGLCSVIFAIVAGIKANDGKDYRYPYSLNLIK
jgi:uncharacterized Tic20 family protein